MYGDPMKDKGEGVCRIQSNPKIHTAKEWLYHHEVDICGWQEIGIAQHLMQRHEKLAERVRDMRHGNIRMSSSNNRIVNIEKFQYGGTAIFAYNLLSNMAYATGADDTNLGRWSWLLLEGHQGRRVRVISAYNPCRTRLNHFATVYSQQKIYFNSKNKDVCPKRQFRRDMCEFITNCQNDGESIVLLIDTNENLTQNHDLQSHLTSEPLFLIDLIRLKHGNLDSLLPTTDRGSYPINATFVSPDLVDIEAGGWLQIGNGLSDHRPLFIDISIKKSLGKFKNSTPPYTTRRLKCNDPMAVHKYNDLLAQQYHHHNTENKLEDFLLHKSEPLSPNDIVKLTKIDRVCTQAVLYAEKRCRHIYASGNSYTPTLHKLGKKIDTLRMIIHQKLGRNISSTKVKRAALAQELPPPVTLPIEVCYQLREEAYSEYRKYAKDAKMHHPNFLDQLIEDKIAEGDTQEANRLNQMKL